MGPQCNSPAVTEPTKGIRHESHIGREHGLWVAYKAGGLDFPASRVFTPEHWRKEQNRERDTARVWGQVHKADNILAVNDEWPYMLHPVFSSTPAPAPVSAPGPSPAPSSLPSPSAESSLPSLKCPMAGTFYRSPAPGEPPFVKKGDKVQKGQVLCIIEAMKLMNEIEADQSGTIVDILVEDSKPVSLDMPLFIFKPYC